nr:Rep protein [Tawny frogmouth aviadenovirus A]
MSVLSSEKYWELVNRLIGRGVTTAIGWQHHDPSEYAHYRRKGFGKAVERILRDVRKHMFWSKLLYDYAVGECPSEIEGNPIYGLLTRNGFSAERVGMVLVKWTAHRSPRNTLWISGYAPTGASALATALAYTAPLMCCADPRNRGNPFEGCSPCLLLWWEGDCVGNHCVDMVKQVFRGEHAFMPEESSREGCMRELFKTPVLVLSNKNMCRTYVRRGVDSAEHEASLRDCMYRLHLTESMPEEESISCQDVRDFLGWALDRHASFKDCHDLKDC